MARELLTSGGPDRGRRGRASGSPSLKSSTEAIRLESEGTAQISPPEATTRIRLMKAFNKQSTM